MCHIYMNQKNQTILFGFFGDYNILTVRKKLLKLKICSKK